jgi:hypothetical protein
MDIQLRRDGSFIMIQNGPVALLQVCFLTIVVATTLFFSFIKIDIEQSISNCFEQGHDYFCTMNLIEDAVRRRSGLKNMSMPLPCLDSDGRWIATIVAIEVAMVDWIMAFYSLPVFLAARMVCDPSLVNGRLVLRYALFKLLSVAVSPYRIILGLAGISLDTCILPVIGGGVEGFTTLLSSLYV